MLMFPAMSELRNKNYICSERSQNFSNASAQPTASDFCRTIITVINISIKVPTSEDFLVNSTGFIILKRRLNFNVSPKYNFVMLAKASYTLLTQFWVY